MLFLMVTLHDILRVISVIFLFLYKKKNLKKIK